MQGQYQYAGTAGSRYEQLRHSAYFSKARQKDEDMAGIAWIRQPLLDQRNDRLAARRPVRRPVFQNDLMHFPLDRHDWAAVQKTRDRLGVERRRHDDQD